MRDGFNWYSYCNGNPVSFVDRDGNKITAYSDPYKDKASMQEEIRKATDMLLGGDLDREAAEDFLHLRASRELDLSYREKFEVGVCEGTKKAMFTFLEAPAETFINKFLKLRT